MRNMVVLTAVALLAAGCERGERTKEAPAPTGGPREAVWVAGSSTVFPFATRVSENVSRNTGGVAAKVESLGTGGGIKLFCAGMGDTSPDIATASRRMKKSEFEACASKGVTEIIELKIGFDGIVIATAKSGRDYDFKTANIYRALAKDVPSGAGFGPNTAATWAEVDPALPAQRIVVYGPPPTSGTRDAFVELAMEAGAKAFPALAALKESDEDAFKARAHTLRSDGAWIDAGENDNAIVQTLTRTPGALGVFGHSFLDNNADQVKAAKINGIAPTIDAVSSGAYPLSRSLYIYVKKAKIGVKPGLREYVQGFVSDAATGPQGYLRERGLIPLPKADHDDQKAVITGLTAMAAPTS